MGLGAAGCAPAGNGAAPPAASAEAASLATRRDQVVYDLDDRVEAYAINDAVLRRRLTASSVMLTRGGALQEDLSGPRVSAPSLAEHEGLCPGERFGEQPALGDCSGTLVGDDLVLLAAHCLPNEACPAAPFVLAPHYTAPGSLAPISVGQVRRCVEVLLWRRVEGMDVALVRLDGTFVGGEPAPVRPADEPLQVGEAVTLLGFPSGVPGKASPGVVLEVAPGGIFHTNVDAFAGNSGGGMFDASGRLVGHLAQGQADYVIQGDCRVVRVLAGDGRDGHERGVLWSTSRSLACDAGAPIAACGAGGGGGTIQGPPGWSCPGDQYADGLVCHCGCGLPDPDCDDEQAPQRGCPESFVCTAEGRCLPEGTAEAGVDGEDEGGCMASAATALPLGALLGGWGAWRRRRGRRAAVRRN